MRRSLEVVVSLALLICPSLVLAHGGHEHVVGTVERITSTTITVKTTSGAKSVALTTATRYYRGSDTKHPATSSDVKDGMRVVVHEGADGKAAAVHIPNRSPADGGTA
jgi:hypothetical protein